MKTFNEYILGEAAKSKLPWKWSIFPNTHMLAFGKGDRVYFGLYGHVGHTKDKDWTPESKILPKFDILYYKMKKFVVGKTKVAYGFPNGYDFDDWTQSYFTVKECVKAINKWHTNPKFDKVRPKDVKDFPDVIPDVPSGLVKAATPKSPYKTYQGYQDAIQKTLNTDLKRGERRIWPELYDEVW